MKYKTGKTVSQKMIVYYLNNIRAYIIDQNKDQEFKVVN